MAILIGAEPAPVAIDPAGTALVVIDMQRDFLGTPPPSTAYRICA